MFKGTRTIGTRGHRAGPADHRAARRAAGRDTGRRGPSSTAGTSSARSTIRPIPRCAAPGTRKLLDEFEALLGRQSDLLIPEDFRPHLHGGGRLGHECRHELRLHHLFRQRAGQQAGAVVLDGERYRLANPVFREFYAERSVVHEERRLRTDSTPIGKFPGAVRGDVLAVVALRLACHRLAERPRRHYAGRGAGVLRHLLRAEQPGRGAGRRLRSGAGHRPGRAVLRPPRARRPPAPAAAHPRDAAARRETG